MTPEISKHEMCRNRVKTLNEDQRHQCVHQPQACNMKNKQAKVLKTMKENHIAKVCSLESSLKAMKESHTSRVNTIKASIKNKNRCVSKLDEKVRVLEEEILTLRSTISLLKTPTYYESPAALTSSDFPPSPAATPSTPTPQGRKNVSTFLTS